MQRKININIDQAAKTMLLIDGYVQ